MADFKQLSQQGTSKWLRDDSRIIDLKPIRPPVLWPAVKRFFNSKHYNEYDCYYWYVWLGTFWLLIQLLEIALKAH
jgi:hypothetical protein